MKTYKVIVDDENTINWYNEKGQLDRLDGPAVEWANGDKEWYTNGKLNRLDGPAAEYVDGTKMWFVDGKCHRLDGPAHEYADGHNDWWIDGKYMTEKQFNEHTKPKPTCEGKIIEVDGIKYKLTSMSGWSCS